MFKLNLFLNIIIIIGLFILDGITGNLLGIFCVIFILLLPKIRGLLLNKDINSSIMYEIFEFILNIYLLFVINRALFDSSINFNNFGVFTYSYTVVRLILVIIILILANLLLVKNNKKEKIVINDLSFGYIILFTSIFGVYFAIKSHPYFGTIISTILCCINVYFCYKLIDELKYGESGLYYSLIISILSLLLGNEILILSFIKIFFTAYCKDKRLFYK